MQHESANVLFYAAHSLCTETGNGLRARGGVLRCPRVMALGQLQDLLEFEWRDSDCDETV